MALQTRGGVVESWDRFDAYHLYGAKPAAMLPQGPADGLDDGLRAATASPTEIRSEAAPWHPDSPLFWFGTILAVTLGFVAASTSIRVGPFKASLAAGKQ